MANAAREASNGKGFTSSLSIDQDGRPIFSASINPDQEPINLQLNFIEADTFIVDEECTNCDTPNFYRHDDKAEMISLYSSMERKQKFDPEHRVVMTYKVSGSVYKEFCRNNFHEKSNNFFMTF